MGPIAKTAVAAIVGRNAAIERAKELESLLAVERRERMTTELECQRLIAENERLSAQIREWVKWYNEERGAGSQAA